MAAVLGVSAYYHDAAAALVVDGRIVAAIQEERLSRRKNDPSLPVRAMDACLQLGDLQPQDLDAVVFYENPFAKLERVLVSLLRTFPRSIRQFPRALGSQLGGKIWIIDQLADALDLPRARIEYSDHHRTHAASAFYTSPFASAAVLVADAVGEHATTSIWLGEERAIRPLSTIEYPHSLGLLYAALTAYLGFAVNEGEYKVMGLASYGKPRYREPFDKLIALAADGSFTLDLSYFAHMTDVDLGFGRKLEDLLGPRRPPGRAWDLESESDRRYADIAATLQAVTEDALLGLARQARACTDADALCLAGGVALNAVANARLLAESGFARVFVQPAAGDAGGALGAAILGSIARGDPRPEPLTSVALGLPISSRRAHELATHLGLRHRIVEDPPAAIAESLAAGKITAVADGRFEWGPRALGQRSILAPPGPADIRDQINRAVKHREPFRPFAPVVLASDADAYFAGAPNDMTPFMTTVCTVRESARAALAAVTHVDGTARVQTTSESDASPLSAILGHVRERTDIPVALNTSLNGKGEPIVASADDAVGFFLQHPLHALFVGDVAIERNPTGT